MAFDLDKAGGFGSGKLGDVTDPNNFINSYAAVFDPYKYTFKIQTSFTAESSLLPWNNCVGCQVLLHVVYDIDPSDLPGKYFVATITEATEIDNGKKITMDKSFTDITNNADAWAWQAILIPEFKNLTLTSKSLKPLTFQNSSSKYGCVLAFKCSDTLTLNGGHIDLRDAGIPPTLSSLDTYRPIFEHETNGTLDTDLYSGSENSITKDNLIVNAGDGACLIVANKIVSAVSSSRIGNPSTNGVQYCRGASDSDDTPSGVSNVGGSTISIITNSWTNFSPNQIAKYRSGSTGRGLARAYLVVRNSYNDILPDEGLYAQDILPDKARCKNFFNLSGFGNGSTGNFNYTTPGRCFNAYAKVTAISGRVYTISKKTLENNSLVDFTVGTLVMIHQSRKASATDYKDGWFKLSRIIAVSGDTVTIKHTFSFNLSNYNVQMIAMAEYNSMSLASAYTLTPPYTDGSGGICAFAVKTNCYLSDAVFNLENMGKGGTVVNPVLGNYSMKGSLPLGNGHGSILIIAKNLYMNNSTRFCATYDGSAISSYKKYGVARAGETPGEQQGAHILLICDTIDGLNMQALSTGGAGAGAGYRDTAGVGGACFIYCNAITDQKTKGIVRY